MKTSLSLIIISIIFFMSSYSFSEEPYGGTSQNDCTPKSLGAYLGPNRSQGDIGWCYANASADLITYHYRKELGGARASAAYIALAYSHDYFHGGMPPLAIMKAEVSGFCLESAEQSVLQKGPQKGIKERLQDLIALKKNFDASNGKSLDNDLKRKYESTHSVLATMPRKDLISLLENSSVSDFPKRFADYFCGQNLRIYPNHFDIAWPLSKKTFGGDSRLLFKQIHHQLDKNNIIAASYFDNFFNFDGAQNVKGHEHASVIIGRRWHKDRCELLIRNSWGSQCYSYTAKSLQEEGMCENGNVYVPESTFSKAIIDTTYIAVDNKELK